MLSKNKKFISILWVYSREMYGLSIEENYNLHILKIAKENGYLPYVILRGEKSLMENDPNFDPSIKIIDYKNIFYYIFNILKFSLQNNVFYVNSYEIQSFLVPFLARKTIFMGHNQTKRGSLNKQRIQNFVFKFFTIIRLNNETEKDHLLSQGIKESKLMVIPLIISQKIFKILDDQDKRKDLVYLGNITTKKNLKTILKALVEVRKIKTDIKLHIIGKIIDEVVSQTIQELDLKDAVVLHGYMIQDEKMTKLLNSLLVFVNSSTDEGQCLSVFDAALCGCVPCLPKIMSFTGVFKDKAIFHEIFDHEQLAKNILLYLNNPDIIGAHKKECVNMIKRDYSKETIEKKLQVLFSKI